MRAALRTALLLGALASTGAGATSGEDRIDPTTASLSGQPPLIEGVEPGTPPPPDQVDAVTQRITSVLRCPVCQGLSVADSTSAAAVMMQRHTRALVAAGYDPMDIEDYYVSKYGQFILLDPQDDGMNRIAWVGPLLAAGFGLWMAATFLRGSSARTATSAAPSPAEATPASPGADDPYAQRLLSEVDDA
jgi:cytochrome c-type biogenesis protein CcmH